MGKHHHIGVYGLLIKDNKIVLIKRSRGAYTGKLDLPGGGLEHGETPEETLKREIMEEVGIKIKDYNLYDTITYCIKWQDNDDIEDLHHIGIIYLVEIEEQKLKEDADGLDSLGASWYEISNLTKDIISPFTYMMLEKLGYKLR